MSLTTELSDVYTRFHATAPLEIANPIKASTAEHIRTFDPSTAIQVGSKFPSFVLSNATGKEISLDSLLSPSTRPASLRGLLISFYRGSWCPFCNLELRALQAHLPAFTSKGVALIAISPELPDTSLSTVEKEGLGFEVLSDVGNGLARELGIVWEMGEEMRGVFEKLGHRWEERYGGRELNVPIPATVLVDSEGVVRRVWLDADYSKRLEPGVALGWCDEL